MLVVDIVVSRSVNQQEVVSLKVVQVAKDTAFVILLGIIFCSWQTHITFSINCIWKERLCLVLWSFYGDKMSSVTHRNITTKWQELLRLRTGRYFYYRFRWSLPSCSLHSSIPKYRNDPYPHRAGSSASTEWQTIDPRPRAVPDYC